MAKPTKNTFPHHKNREAVERQQMLYLIRIHPEDNKQVLTSFNQYYFKFDTSFISGDERCLKKTSQKSSFRLFPGRLFSAELTSVDSFCVQPHAHTAPVCLCT